ncbi:MAG: hypothetical protein WC325_12325, partial [Candidatus Bathyarchaeia archaeon]
YKDPQKAKQHQKEYWKKNKDLRNAKRRQDRKERPEHYKKLQHQHYLRTKKKCSARSAKYYSKNREAIKEKSNDYYYNNKEKVLQNIANYRQKNSNIILERKKSYREKNRGKLKILKHNDYEKQGWLRMTTKDYKLKMQAFAILGNKCTICGFDDPRALQIDHINGNGHTESRKIGLRAIRLKIIQGDTKNYQLLCANCNWIKRSENGEVGGVHRKQRMEKVALLFRQNNNELAVTRGAE